jgi:hypothetical protein
MYFIMKDHDGNNTCIRTSEGALIPFDEGNVDYQIYLVWVEQGNTAEEFDNGL